jgi:molybdopterin-guanine dinucleotide biosynthesis protein A
MSANAVPPAHPPVTGLVLAGGRSTRFGSDKASALLAGRPLLQWVTGALSTVCEALVVVRAAGQQLPPIETPLPLAVAEDRYPGKGPLAGIVSGFPAVATPLCLVTSCDAPLLQPALVSFLAGLAEGQDIVCPYVEGFVQPLVAVYRPRTCLAPFEEAVERDVLKITAAWGPLEVRVVREPEIRTADPELLSFRNANRPEALAELEELVAGRGLA